LAGLQRWLSIALGVAILLGFLVSKKISLSAPVVRLVARLKSAMSAQLRQRSIGSLALLGMLNGLLPCCLVYVAMHIHVGSRRLRADEFAELRHLARAVRFKHLARRRQRRVAQRKCHRRPVGNL